MDLSNLLLVAAAGFAAPLALGLVPSLRLPSVVVELLLGILIGPAVLGWVEVDDPVRVLALIGLAVLLFLAGLELDPARLRGRTLRITVLAFALSIALALGAGGLLVELGLAQSPVFLAVLLSATSLGVLVPVLKDTGQVATGFGQLVIAAATISDFGAVILLSLLVGDASASPAAQAVLLGGILASALLAGLAIAGVEHSRRLGDVLLRLQDTTAQIRVRGAFVLLLAFAALASTLGLEVILGAFLAGVLLSLVDRDQAMTHPAFRRKLDAVGFGVFVPVFFVTSGVTYDLGALTASGSSLLLVPVFLLALLVVRGLPAILYRPLLGDRRSLVAGLMQATSLPFIVAGTAIGRELGLVSAGEAAALVAAGLVSVVVFPALSLTLLRRQPPATDPALSPSKQGALA